MVPLSNDSNQRKLLVSLTAFGLFAFACSNDEDSLPAGNPATGGTNGSAATGAQNRGGGGASSAIAGGASSSPYGGDTNSSQLGRIIISSRSPICTVNAAFYQSLPPSKCASVRDFGVCVVTSGCSDPRDSAALASAGDVTLTSAKSAIDVKITPGQDNRYSQGGLHCLSGSEALSVTATGATVPAFSADIDVPLVLLADSPTADSSGVVLASSSADLVLKVSRGAKDVRLIVSGGPAATDVDLMCEADSSQGELTIPAAALDALGEGAELRLVTEKTTFKAVGSWDLEVTTYMGVYTSDRTNEVSIRIQ